MSNQLIEKIREECLRIEEDALYSSKSHYNASSPWEKCNLIIGIPIAILSAIAGLSALKDMTTITIVISFLLTCLTAINTALNTSKRAGHHKSGQASIIILKTMCDFFERLN